MIEGWKQKPVEEICERVSVGIVIKPSQYYVDEGQGVRAFRSTNVAENRIVDENWVYLSPEGHAANAKSCLRTGDVLVVRSGTPGTACVVTPEFQGSNCIDVVFARPNPKAVLPEYLAEYTNSAVGKQHVLGNKGGLALQHFNVGAYKEMLVLLPPLPEQRKIAEILRTWDEAIEKASELIELSRVQYSGLRERLINWQTDPQERLGSLVEPISRAVPRPNEPYRALSIRSHGKGTFSRMVADPTSVDMDTLYVARDGDLIVNITFAWEGAVALVPQEHDGCLVSHRFPTFVPSSPRVDARYLRHALRMPRFTYLLGLVSPGGAGRNRVLNKGDFLNLEVPAPDLGKQERIAACLDAAEDAIANATEYREALTRQKRGLMQKLLTGEWRVAV